MDILDYLPQKIKTEAALYMRQGLEEIRVRAGQPTQYIMRAGYKKGRVLSIEDVKEMLNYLSDYSLYAMKEQLKCGFFTVEGGHRIGITAVGSVLDISSLNIRIAHQIKGCSNVIMPYIRNNGRIYNTIIVSRPGAGKTTCLRDCIRELSSGNEKYKSLKVAVVDERSEIAACYRGVPQNDLGPSCDVMDNCKKVVGMRMLLRSMSPDVIAVDELGAEEDFMALSDILKCGINIIGTIHGSEIADVKNKKIPAGIERIIFIEKDKNGRRQFYVYDKDYRCIGGNDRGCGTA